MKNIFLGMLCTSLIACASKEQPPTMLGLPNPTKPKATLHVDPMLLEPCLNFSNIVDNPAPLDVLIKHADDRKILNACSEKHRGLAKIVEKILAGD